MNAGPSSIYTKSGRTPELAKLSTSQKMVIQNCARCPNSATRLE
jgi:hypothetical protein